MSPSGTSLLQRIAILCSLAGAATVVPEGYASPALQIREFPAWTAPGAGDVRSPCPGLNAAANHGFLPHDGKKLTLDVVASGLEAAYNVDLTLATFLWAGALLLVSPNPLGGSWDLDDLDKHNAIEHDASLSRSDAYFGNNTVFNESNFESVLSFYDSMENATIPVASQARYSRVQDSQTRNPTYTMDANHFLLSYGESALYLSIMGDPTTGVAPVEYVKILFEQERLPYNEGWRTPTQLVTLASLTDVIARLYSNSPDPVSEGTHVITEGTYRLALANLDQLKQKLGGLYCTILPPLC